MKETWWWNDEVLEVVKRKKEAKKKWEISGSDADRANFRTANKEAKRTVAQAKARAEDGVYKELKETKKESKEIDSEKKMETEEKTDTNVNNVENHEVKTEVKTEEKESDAKEADENKEVKKKKKEVEVEIVLKEELKPESYGAMEDIMAKWVQRTTCTEETKPEEDKRGVKRGQGSHDDRDRKKPKVEDKPLKPKAENEPEMDMTKPLLDWYNSDVSLRISPKSFLTAEPMIMEGFAYMWHGVRSTLGCSKGKVFYEVKLERNMDIKQEVKDSEQHPFVVRCGWSLDSTTTTLGEEKYSYGYGGTGKASTDLKFKDYGKVYAVGDVIGCFMDMDSEPMVMSFTVNGENQGICYEINHDELKGEPLFPHILTKNCAFKVNFGSEDPWFEPLTGYTAISKVEAENLHLGTQKPDKKEDAEVIMMVGLPGAGKTTWVEKYVKEHPEKKFNILGTNNMIDKMKVMGLPRKRNYAGRWENLIESCTKCMNKLLFLASSRRRNYIIDQTNVYPSAQKRKIKNFFGCQRKAVVICPTDDDLKERTLKREKEEGKDVPDSAVLEMKANFKLPEKDDYFTAVEFVELDEDEAKKLVEKYNKDGEVAGYGPNKEWSITPRDRNRDRGFKGGNRGGGSGGWIRNRNSGGGGGGFSGRSGGGGGGFGGRGGGGGDRFNKDNRDNRNRQGGGGGFNRNNQYGGNKQGGGGGGNWGGNQMQQGGGNNNQSWGQPQQQYGQQQGYGNQNYGGGQMQGQTGYGAQGGGYNWNQAYYGQQQQAAATGQQSYAASWQQQGYNAQGQTGVPTSYAGAGQQSYSYDQSATTGQNAATAAQWSAYYQQAK